MLCAFNQFDCPGLFGYIVSLFKSSTIACATFKEAQECERPYSLKQECPTRWNTGYHMLDRILITKIAIASVLLNTPKGLMPPTSEEISILEDLKAILSPFQHATVHTSSSTSVTVSSVIYPVKLDKAVSPLVGRGLLECDPLLNTNVCA